MLIHATRILILIGALGLTMILCAGLLFLLSGESNPITFARDTYLRLQLLPLRDDLNEAIGTDPTTIQFVVPAGATARQIGEKLEAEGLVTSADAFTLYAQLDNLDASFGANTYYINRAMTIKEIAQALTDPRFAEIQLVVLPGQRIEEVAATVDSFRSVLSFDGETFLSVIDGRTPLPAAFTQAMAIPVGASLEGFLIPDTYLLEPSINALELRDIMLARFDAAFTPQMRRDAAAQGYSPYDIVTLASIVEREAIYADEYPIVASVYRNRLEIDDDLERLDADPTVQYGHPNAGPGNWWPRISAADYYSVVSPYNTYLNTGMPPGPISNPSFAAIEGTLSPQQTPYLFFRADCRGDNRHDFFTNYDDHRAAC